MNKTAIMQPYLFPYIGYWQMIAAVDNYVVYDDVNFIKGGWINRNNILLDGKTHLLTFRLNGASSFKKINEIEVEDSMANKTKLISKINSAYSKAPYFEDIISLIERILNYSNRNLAKFTFNHLTEICNYLDIKTNLILSSSIQKDNNLKAQDKVIDICKGFNTDLYINAIGGRDLYSKEDFKKVGIELKFLQTKIVEYKQFKNPFVANLSIIDLMMFNSKDELKEMLQSYNLS